MMATAAETASVGEEEEEEEEEDRLVFLELLLAGIPCSVVLKTQAENKKDLSKVGGW